MDVLHRRLLPDQHPPEDAQPDRRFRSLRRQRADLFEAGAEPYADHSGDFGQAQTDVKEVETGASNDGGVLKAQKARTPPDLIVSSKTLIFLELAYEYCK